MHLSRQWHVCCVSAIRPFQDQSHLSGRKGTMAAPLSSAQLADLGEGGAAATTRTRSHSELVSVVFSGEVSVDDARALLDTMARMKERPAYSTVYGNLIYGVCSGNILL